MYLLKLKELYIPSDFQKQSYYDYLFKAREVNEIIEEVILSNVEKYKVYDGHEIVPLIINVQDCLCKRSKKPVISLLYHLPTISVIVELYNEKIVVIKSDEKNTIELENTEYEQLKNIFL